ncbi:mitochondrial cardiolipin hydrolase [Nycticebus coucang]|uniref:mitochondrial cardiolipin hydrolase n=1 Tax=Nycticebus coucang TaxID=9470 RepID=UPI00234C3354|nr:mitochondrial cardiolipin hydrolase [Nycticebus coucang]
MRPLGWSATAAVAVGLALALEALPWVLRRLRAGRRRPRREVLFFPSQVTCTEALLQAPGAPAGPHTGCPCSLPHGESSLSRLLRALLAARASLELCLFAFSSPQLGRAVQLLHQRGVRVRAITDCDYMALNGSQIGLLRKAGRWAGRRWAGRGRASGLGTASRGRRSSESGLLPASQLLFPARRRWGDPQERVACPGKAPFFPSILMATLGTAYAWAAAAGRVFVTVAVRGNDGLVKNSACHSEVGPRDNALVTWRLQGWGTRWGGQTSVGTDWDRKYG